MVGDGACTGTVGDCSVDYWTPKQDRGRAGTWGVIDCRGLAGDDQARVVEGAKTGFD